MNPGGRSCGRKLIGSAGQGGNMVITGGWRSCTNEADVEFGNLAQVDANLLTLLRDE